MNLADVIPIHKGGSQGSASNYRPVALTSHLSKVFEKVVRKFIVAFLEEHNLFNPTQHGFRLGRSYLSQLIDHYDHITQLLEKGENVDVIYLDFCQGIWQGQFPSYTEKNKTTWNIWQTWQMDLFLPFWPEAVCHSEWDQKLLCWCEVWSSTRICSRPPVIPRSNGRHWSQSGQCISI